MIYKPEFAEQAADLCDLGATDEELAEHFQVCVRTIYRWRNAHEEFAEAVVAGKEHADARVERALYSRAVGCSVQRTRVFKHVGDEKPVYATYTHHLPPDANAALQWLRVRQREKWGVQAEEEDTNLGLELEKALARVAAYDKRNAIPPNDAATPDPEPDPEPEPEPEPAPESEPEPELEPETQPASAAPPSERPGSAPAATPGPARSQERVAKPPPTPPPDPSPDYVSTVGRVYAPAYAPIGPKPDGYG